MQTQIATENDTTDTDSDRQIQDKYGIGACHCRREKFSEKSRNKRTVN